MVVCLPSNSKINLDNRVDDLREGMLSYCNDGVHYGLLRLINNNGNAIVPMASSFKELIFSGNAGTTGIYSSSKVFDAYSFINITAEVKSSSATSLTTITIPVDDFLLSSSSSSYRISIPSNVISTGYIDIHYVSDSEFNITVELGDLTSIAITKIYGIY